ncbi:hypothetical protein BDC45DRAFT_606759 [Circinella umbellata]|nr:hypothetical protein BDC45DRAFT_606759 [Circinella umbellata]
MNQTLDFIEILPIEVIIDIFMRLEITTFKTFLFYYWIGPSWRRILMQYILPNISLELAQNLLVSNCTGNKHQLMREKISTEISMANRLNRPVSFPFSFLFFMYHVDDIIDIDYNYTRSYHGVFFRPPRTISNILLICGSSCLKNMNNL